MDDRSPEPTDAPRIERVELNAAGKLVVHLAGRDEPIVGAQVARCFPWSLPESQISIRDAEGSQIVLLESVAELAPASRRVVEAELRDKVFNPKILRVLNCTEEFGVTSITAETDRGEVTFQIGSHENVRQLSPVRALFRDVDGNTYELPDFTALDAASQRRLQQYF